MGAITAETEIYPSIEHEERLYRGKACKTIFSPFDKPRKHSQFATICTHYLHSLRVI